VGLALPAQLARPALREHKASKDQSVLRAQSESRGRLALWDRRDPSARRGRREKRVAKAQLAPPASADHQGRKAPLAPLDPPDQLARRVTPARHRQFASSPVRIAFAAETTKSWRALFARAARPTEPSARRPARQQLVYARVDDLIIASRLPARSAKTECAGETRFADRGTRALSQHSCQAVPVSDTTSS
jgi:hypothetical protein